MTWSGSGPLQGGPQGETPPSGPTGALPGSLLRVGCAPTEGAGVLMSPYRIHRDRENAARRDWMMERNGEAAVPRGHAAKVRTVARHAIAAGGLEVG